MRRQSLYVATNLALSTILIEHLSSEPGFFCVFPRVTLWSPVSLVNVVVFVYVCNCCRWLVGIFRMADLSLAPMPAPPPTAPPMSGLSAAAVPASVAPAAVDPYAGLRDPSAVAAVAAAAQRGFSTVRVAAPPPGVAAFGAAGPAQAAQLVTPAAAPQLYTPYPWAELRRRRPPPTRAAAAAAVVVVIVLMFLVIVDVFLLTDSSLLHPSAACPKNVRHFFWNNTVNHPIIFVVQHLEQICYQMIVWSPHQLYSVAALTCIIWKQVFYKHVQLRCWRGSSFDKQFSKVALKLMLQIVALSVFVTLTV